MTNLNNSNTTSEATWGSRGFKDSERAHYQKWKGHAKYASPEEERDQYACINSKACSKRQNVKPLIYFNGNTSGRDAFDKNGYRLRRPECSLCTKTANRGKDVARRIAKVQGVSYKAPEGTCCAICGKAYNKMVFDHCHEKELFRGYLCDPCNRSLGVLGDNVQGLIAAINYLNKTEKMELTVAPGGTLSARPPHP